MPIHDHEPSFRGRAFLWGGIALGLLFLAALFTHGFGLIGGSGRGAAEPALMVRQGDKILVPEGSALRGRLSVMPAPTQAVSAKLTLPAIVESDPARTAALDQELADLARRHDHGTGTTIMDWEYLILTARKQL